MIEPEPDAGWGANFPDLLARRLQELVDNPGG